jgi:hypothetical protein
VTTKAPTASGISRLLAAAGFERAAIRLRGGNSGFQVTKCRTRNDAVKVHQYFQLSATDSPAERYRGMLRRYAKAIEAAGYGTEVYTYHLIVTAKAEEA